MSILRTILARLLALRRAARADRDRHNELYKPNTNIEKLSDWLTKIVVGVGLVTFHELGPTIAQAVVTTMAQHVEAPPRR
jgi:hypothetical protein